MILGGPGSGKTCVLLDLADHLESKTEFGLLFIKADEYQDYQSEEEIAHSGLTKDIAGQCSRLAILRPVVIIIDSLDVLSTSRQYRPLRYFLSLIDQLRRIDNVAIVAACREFDLKYDPHLRDRDWGTTVTISPLDYQTQASPLLSRLGNDPDKVPENRRHALCNPQYLKHYAKLVHSGVSSVPMSHYGLYELLIDELIVHSPELGQHALDAIQTMAHEMLTHRSTGIAKAAFKLPSSINKLQSLEIIQERTPGRLEFSHQTWLEMLSVRYAITHGNNLPGSRYFCESLFWASKPKQTAKTSRDRLCLRRP
ncbi:hypothetical protein BOW53_08485, partial [Solemya pervernicosa gill symbiont]